MSYPKNVNVMKMSAAGFERFHSDETTSYDGTEKLCMNNLVCMYDKLCMNNVVCMTRSTGDDTVILCGVEYALSDGLNEFI